MIAAIAVVDPLPTAVTSGDIVVTGERLSQQAWRTASSLVVVSATDLDAEPPLVSVDQLLAEIPNVQLGSQGVGPTIRGQDTTGALRDLSAFLGGNRPRTTLIVDGRAVGYNGFVFGSQSLWDVAEVEVYRTPQSTTQGHNSIAGAIFVNSEDPTFIRGFSWRLIAQSSSRDLSLAINTPLSEELSTRLALDWLNGRTNSRLSDPSRPTFNLNHVSNKLARFKFLYAPKFLRGTRLMLIATRSQAEMPQVEGLAPPFSVRRDAFATYGFFSTKSDSITARANVSVTSLLKVDVLGSGGRATALRAAPVGFGVANNLTRDRSLEVVAHWDALDTVRITFGAAVQQQRVAQDIDLSAVLGDGRFHDRQQGLGLFGSADIQLTHRIAVSAGVRWQKDQQTRSGQLDGVRGPEQLRYDGKSSFLLPRVNLTYSLNDRLVAGILALRASNPGGTTISINGPLAFAPETLWDFEIFARASVASDRLQVAANLFETHLRDSQRAVPRLLQTKPGRFIGFADILNVPLAHSSGLEGKVDWSPSHGFRLHLSAALLSTRLRAAAGQPFGKTFQRAPKWSARAAVEWQASPKVLVSAQARGHAAYFSDDLNNPATVISPSMILDARISRDMRAGRLFAYVRNVANRLQLTSYLAPDLATAEDPREVGVGIEGRF